MNAPTTLMEGRPVHEALPAGESNALRTIMANASAMIVGAVRA